MSGAPSHRLMRFQFHIGSIKTRGSGRVDADVSMFQFHIGSIKTKASLSPDTLFIGFNSTLVRLRLERVTETNTFDV